MLYGAKSRKLVKKEDEYVLMEEIGYIDAKPFKSRISNHTPFVQVRRPGLEDEYCYGIFDAEGNELIPPEYSQIDFSQKHNAFIAKGKDAWYIFCDGKCVVRITTPDTHLWINRNDDICVEGKEIYPAATIECDPRSFGPYTNVQALSNGFLMVFCFNQKGIFYKDKEVIPFGEYDDILYLYDHYTSTRELKFRQGLPKAPNAFKFLVTKSNSSQILDLSHLGMSPVYECDHPEVTSVRTSGDFYKNS